MGIIEPLHPWGWSSMQLIQHNTEVNKDHKESVKLGHNLSDSTGTNRQSCLLKNGTTMGGNVFETNLKCCESVSHTLDNLRIDICQYITETLRVSETNQKGMLLKMNPSGKSLNVPIIFFSNTVSFPL